MVFSPAFREFIDELIAADTSILRADEMVEELGLKNLSTSEEAT